MEYAHAEALEPLDRIVRRDPLDDRAHVILNGAEVDDRLYGRYAERCRVPHRIGDPRGGDQRLRRYAAGVQAVAPHAILLYADHGCAHLYPAGGDAQTAGTHADDPTQARRAGKGEVSPWK